MIIIENKTTNQSISFHLEDLASHEFYSIDEQNVYNLIAHKKQKKGFSLNDFGNTLIVKIAKCPENLAIWQKFMSDWKEGKLGSQTFLTFV